MIATVLLVYMSFGYSDDVGVEITKPCQTSIKVKLEDKNNKMIYLYEIKSFDNVLRISHSI